MKVKMEAIFICPGCGRNLYRTEYKGDEVLTCYKYDCPNQDRYFELPEIEVKEYEDKNSKESN